MKKVYFPRKNNSDKSDHHCHWPVSSPMNGTILCGKAAHHPIDTPNFQAWLCDEHYRLHLQLKDKWPVDTLNEHFLTWTVSHDVSYTITAMIPGTLQDVTMSAPEIDDAISLVIDAAENLKRLLRVET